MHVQFDRPATVGGVTYGKGVHDVPDNARKDWYFEKLVSAGEIRVLNGPVQVAVAANIGEQAAKDAAAILEKSAKK